MNLVVVSKTFSFTLGVSPTTRVVTPGAVVSSTVAVTGVNGFSQPVTLTIVGLPASVGTDWSINPVAPDDSSILTRSLPSRPSFGEHALRVVGMAERQLVAKDVRLIVDYPYKLFLPIVLK